MVVVGGWGTRGCRMVPGLQEVPGVVGTEGGVGVSSTSGTRHLRTYLTNIDSKHVDDVVSTLTGGASCS